MFKELWRIIRWMATIACVVIIFAEVKDRNTQIILTVLGLIYVGFRAALLGLYATNVASFKLIEVELAAIKAEMRGEAHHLSSDSATSKSLKETHRSVVTGSIFLGIFEVICLLNLFRLIF